MSDRVNRFSKTNWGFVIFIFANIVVSLLPRLPFMNRISSNWRSSQTLLTSFWFQKEGISLFHSQLPVFGPPWEVPFEFPLYQAISTVFSNITQLNITASSRVVSVAFFYVSALFLLLLCLELLDNKILSSIIFLVYLWLPYNIYFSTEILIDYLSVTLALGYIFWIKKFLDSRHNLVFFLLAIIFGCLGATIKITTMAITIIPSILITLNGIHLWGIKVENLTIPKEILAKIGQQKASFLLMTMIAILPVLLAGLWTRFADAIKQSNIFTVWLVSENLRGWTFGGWGQKTSFTDWWAWLIKINNFFFMEGLLLVFLLAGIAFLYKMPSTHRSFYGAALISVLLTIFIFFNLYRHDYYYIAVSAYMSVLIGFGLYCLNKFLLAHKIWWIIFSMVFLFFVLIRGIEQYRAFQGQFQAEINFLNTDIIPLANKVAARTPKDKYIISFQSEWYPYFILYTQRKGLIISPREYKKFNCDLIRKYDYHTLVVVDSDPDAPKQLGIFECFQNIRMGKSNIYRVQP